MTRTPRPPFGLCLPIRKKSTLVIDGDTIEVSFLSGIIVWRIRLIDCWVDDKNKPLQAEAKIGAKEFIDAAKELAVWFPLPQAVMKLLKGLIAKLNPLKAATFDRVPGYIYLDENLTLNEAMRIAGYATLEKPPKPKKKT